MRYSVLLIACLFFTFLGRSQNPRATTYSIVAVDPETGNMGVAVQSHWFAVGTVVPWGKAGVGVVATQSMANPDYGPGGLELMREGLSPRDAVRKLIRADDGRAYRQVALLDDEGRVAVHTGDSCIAAAGHHIGEGYAVQANLMKDKSVWPAMAERFEETFGQPLVERFLATLEAAQKAGGDIRGKQSAAILVVRAESTGSEYEDRVVDLRVDDHRKPLEELRRLYDVHQAYDWLAKGDRALAEGDTVKARDAYRMSMQLYPVNMELRAWAVVGWLNSGEDERAARLFRIVHESKPDWKEILLRLQDVGLIHRSGESLKEWLSPFESE